MKKIFIPISLLIVFYYGCQSHYEKGLDFLKEEKYNDALSEFKDVDEKEKDFILAQSKISFIEGVENKNKEQFNQALTNFKKVIDNDEYKAKADSLIESIRSNTKYMYETGKEDLIRKDYSSAFEILQKLPDNCDEFIKAKYLLTFISAFTLQENRQYNNAIDSLRTITQNSEIYGEAQNLIAYIDRKKSFIDAKNYYNRKEYKKANELLKLVQSTDDFYTEAKELIIQIETINYLDEIKEIKSFDYINTMEDGACNVVNGVKYHPPEDLNGETFKAIVPVNWISKNNLNNGVIKFDDGMRIVVNVDRQPTRYMMNEYIGRLSRTWIGTYGIKIDQFQDRIKNENVIKSINKSPIQFKIVYVYKVNGIDVDYKETFEGNDCYENTTRYIIPETLEFFIINQGGNIIYKSKDTDIQNLN